MKLMFAGVETTLGTWVHTVGSVLQKGAAAFLSLVPSIDKAAPTVEELVGLASPAVADGVKLSVMLLDAGAAEVANLEATAKTGVLPLTENREGAWRGGRGSSVDHGEGAEIGDRYSAD